jgi:hypothetical protein
MTVLSAPTVKLNKRAKLMFALVIVFFAIPILVFMSMAFQGFADGAGDKDPHDVVATRVSSSAATIAWVTAGKVSATVEYGTTPGSLQTYAPEVSTTKEHEVDLTFLSPATTYYYQIRIKGNKYDNNGVPWTFTTKTVRGEEVIAAVKGATTKLSVAPSASPTPKFGTNNCEATECSDIKAQLGKGCSASDYLQCIATSSASPSNLSTPTPTPSPVSILSSSCRIKYLQVQPGKNCTEWTWDPYAIKTPECKDAFYQYVFQCSSKNFNSTNTDDVAIWYYNNAISNMTTNSITLNSAPESKVYCQVRAEDVKGNATAWVQVQDDYPCN